MELGVSSPSVASRTVRQLNVMSTVVGESASLWKEQEDNGGGGLGLSGWDGVDATGRRSAIVAAYAATELHLMASSYSSDDYDDTWNFLGDRVRNLQFAAEFVPATTAKMSRLGGLPLPPLLNVDRDVATATAAAAAASLGGAALSLLHPAASGMASAAAPMVVEWIRSSSSSRPPLPRPRTSRSIPQPLRQDAAD